MGSLRMEAMLIRPMMDGLLQAPGWGNRAFQGACNGEVGSKGLRLLYIMGVAGAAHLTPNHFPDQCILWRTMVGICGCDGPNGHFVWGTGHQEQILLHPQPRPRGL